MHVGRRWAALLGLGMPLILLTAPPISAVSPHRRAWRQGLFTVARVGRRLVYRKGYLGDIPVHVVIANLANPEIKIGVMVARAGIGSTESFAGMMHRAQPAAAITGTFFGVHSGLPTGDLVVNGHAVYQGFIGTALAFTVGNRVSFIRTAYKKKTTWRAFDGVIRAGPLLVCSGRIVVGPREEGFTSLSAAARRPRTAVGLTPGRKLLLLAVREPISLWRLAKLMRALGASNAVAMDGGSSTGLYFRGRIVVPPARALTNVLLLYADPGRYEQAKASFLGDHPRPAVLPSIRPPSAPAIVVQVLPAADSDKADSARTEEPLPAASALPSDSARPAAAGPRPDAGTLPSGPLVASPLHPIDPAAAAPPEAPAGSAPAKPLPAPSTADGDPVGARD